MLNRQAVVRNPRPELKTAWSGRVIGFYDEPTVILELDGGTQMALPAAWLEVAPTSPDSGRETDRA